MRVAHQKALLVVAKTILDRFGYDRISGDVAHEIEGFDKIPARPVAIEHDGFVGDIIGAYQRRDGIFGVVLQQEGTMVVHVYGEKWID